MKSDPAAAYEALIQFLYRAPIGLLQITLDGEITMINPMSAQLLMPLATDGNLVNLFDVLQPVAPHLRALARAPAQAGGVLCDALRIQAGAPQAAVRTLELSLIKLDDAVLMASVNDVTLAVQQEQQRLATQLRDANRTDALTSMPNRAVVLERVTHALECARADPDYHFAVLFINGDRFNRVNVMLGHALGDDLLRMMATRLNSIVRLGDAVGRTASPEPTAARLGSDEFVVVLEGLRRADDVHGIAQRLVDVLSKPYGIGGHQIHATASMGIVLDAQATGDASVVLQDASLAMHEAKRAGGARYSVFEPPMKERAARRAGVEADLRQGIARGELFVLYQPIVALGCGNCVGAEALVRWRHPVRGIVPPIEFIDIAEETGLIRPLGEFVLNAACREFVRWQQRLGARAPRTLSVNLSRAQLADDGLVEQVRSILAANRMDPRCLQLEVTESLAAQDEVVQVRLHELKALGLTLALDDFGTGYSSLASLHQLPVDVVKIDRSFVSQVEASPHHRVLIEATVLVAQSLGMGTVAEGIETAGQAAELTRLECEKGQGYLFARPLAAEEAATWIAERNAARVEPVNAVRPFQRLAR